MLSIGVMHGSCDHEWIKLQGIVILVHVLSDLWLKGHTQLVHMRIRYHFLAYLHITLHHKSRAE